MMSNEHPPALACASTGLDADALARLTELDPKGENHLLERVLQAFKTSAARLMPQLEAAHSEQDRDTVRLVAHTMKSSSASIGALKLSQVCAQVEALTRAEPVGAGSAQELDPLLHTLRSELDAALSAIQRLLGQAP